MLTLTQKQTARAIVNLFETSAVLGDYGKVTVLAGDTGHLTFGRSQTTLGSGNLHKLLERYCANAGARFGSRLAKSLPRVAARDFGLDTDLQFHNVLRASADDRVMRDTQDAFFDEVYWAGAAKAAAAAGLGQPLSVAVVYDSTVHGSWGALRDRTHQRVGPVAAAGEKTWVSSYVSVRRDWLASHSNSLLRKTTYRMDAFRRLIAQDAWGLGLPLVVRDAEISLASLSGTPAGCYDGPQPGSRSLAVQSPLARGLDVRLVQLALSERGNNIVADGIFGSASAAHVRAHQQANGLPATGVADPALVATLVDSLMQG